MVHRYFILSSRLFVSLSLSRSCLEFFFAEFFCACKIVATVSRVIMEGSLESSGWNSSEVYEAMHRYQSAQAHAFQPYQAPLQEHVGSVGVPEFFQAPCGNHIPLPPPLIVDMCASNLKRKGTEEIGDEDVQIITLVAPKKKRVATSKKPQKKNMKDVEEDKELSSKNWRDRDVETMIAMRGEMEPEFFKNAKKQGKFFANLNFLKRKVLISDLANLVFLKAFAFASRPRAPLPPQGL
jgi:hypothetical protein